MHHGICHASSLQERPIFASCLAQAANRLDPCLCLRGDADPPFRKPGPPTRLLFSRLRAVMIEYAQSLESRDSHGASGAVMPHSGLPAHRPDNSAHRVPSSLAGVQSSRLNFGGAAPQRTAAGRACNSDARQCARRLGPQERCYNCERLCAVLYKSADCIRILEGTRRDCRNVGIGLYGVSRHPKSDRHPHRHHGRV